MICKSAYKSSNHFHSQKVIPKIIRLKKWVLISVFAVITFSAKAQFTYLESGFTYDLTIYSLNFEAATVHNNLKWNIGGMWRPIRMLGIGATVGIPVLQGTSFNFQGSLTDVGDFYNFDPDFSTGMSDRYIPDVYDYNLKYSPNFTLVFRMFFSGQSSVYSDLRLGVLNINETLQIKRDYQPAVVNSYGGVEYAEVQELNIYKEYRHRLVAPGTAIGFNKSVSQRLSFGMNIGLDLLIFPEDPFEVKFPYDWNFSKNKHSEVTLTGKGQGVKPIFSINFSFNYSF